MTMFVLLGTSSTLRARGRQSLNRKKTYALYLFGHILLIIVFLVPLGLVWTFAIEYSLVFSLFYCVAFVFLIGWVDIRQIQVSFLSGKKVKRVDGRLRERDVNIYHHEIELFVPRATGYGHGQKYTYMRLSVTDVDSQKEITRISFGGDNKILVGFSQTLLWYCQFPIFGPPKLVGFDVFKNKTISRISIHALEFNGLRPKKRRKGPEEALLDYGMRNNMLPNYLYENSFILKSRFARINDVNDKELTIDLNTGSVSTS
jgi:hypothetical protein